MAVETNTSAFKNVKLERLCNFYDYLLLYLRNYY